MRSRRTRLTLVAAAAALLTVLGSLAAPALTASGASASSTGIFSDDLEPQIAADSDRDAVELGVRFTPQNDGEVTALQYYQGVKTADVTTATLWSPDGAVLGRANFTASTEVGWRTVSLDERVAVNAGETYTASYQAPRGGYVVTNHDFTAERTQNGFTLGRNAGVYRYGQTAQMPRSSYQGSNYLVDVVLEAGSATDEPTVTPPQKPEPEPEPGDPTPEPPTGEAPTDGQGTIVLGRSFPSAETTGVPSGTNLTDYSGPCTIDADNVSIDAKVIDCDLQVRGQNLKITNSVVIGTVYGDRGSFSMTDSEVRMPARTATGVGEANFVLTRVEITGGNRSVNCASNCTVQDSYLHGQYTDKRGVDHESAIRMGANSTIRHNSIVCDATPVPPDAGCSAALTGYGDFAVVQKNTIDNNLIDGGPYGSVGFCAYGGSSPGKPYSAGVNNIKFTDNVFRRGSNGKCGIWGPITSFDSHAPGNVWSNNLWEDGEVVAPSN